MANNVSGVHSLIDTAICDKELAASLIRLVGVLLDSPDGFASDMTKVLECIFVKALIWSVGSCVDRKGRQMFGDYLRMVMEDKGLETSDAHQDFLLKNRSWVARDRPIALLPPDDGRLLYDFRFDAKKGQWQPWLETVSSHGIHREEVWKGGRIEGATGGSTHTGDIAGTYIKEKKTAMATYPKCSMSNSTD